MAHGMTQPIHAGFSNSLTEGATLPESIQFMPPGRHRIRASQGGKAVSVEVAVDAGTAGVLQTFLAARLAAAVAGRDDRPFFDFNHEDREAAAWPSEFFWAGDDPVAGGVRAKVEWSDAGRRAVEGRTFRRFSPTFHVDAAGHVTGSEINMGGLVNRAAFKRIAPLFAGAPVDTAATPEAMQNLISTLRSHELIDAAATEEADMVAQVTRSVSGLKGQIADLKATQATQARQRAEGLVDGAVRAGRIAAKDADSRAFWVEAVLRDEGKAVKALDALPVNPVLARLTTGAEEPGQVGSLLVRQEQKLAAVRAANPGADFAAVYAKAKAEEPGLFR